MSKHTSKSVSDDALVERLHAAETYIKDFVTDPSYTITTTPEGLVCLEKYPESISNLQIHILVVSLTTHTFYEVIETITHTVEKFSSFTPVMFADATVRLIQRGFLKKEIIESRRASVSIDGTLTISLDGTISFVPSDNRFHIQSGTKTWLLISNLKPNIPTTRPIHIDGHSAKVNY